MTQPVEVTLTRLEGKIDVITERVANQSNASGETARQLQRSIDEVKNAVQKAREEARHESSAVRVAVEGQINDVKTDLTEHQDAVNPHPRQEDWMRENLRDLNTKVADLRDTLAQNAGASRTMKWLIGIGVTVGAGMSSGAVQLLTSHRG